MLTELAGVVSPGQRLFCWSGSHSAHGAAGGLAAGFGGAGCVAGGASGRVGRGVRPVPARRRRRRGDRGGRGVLPGPAGGRPVGEHAALVWAGSAALVQVLVGDRCPVEPGVADRGAGLLSVDADRGQAEPPALAPSRRAGGATLRGEGLRAVGAGALRDGAALLLRVPPGCRRRPGPGQPLPVEQVAARRPGERAPQSDGAVHATSGAGSTVRESRRGSRARSRTRSSTRSSPGCRRIGTGRWWRSTCPPGPGPRSCCRRRMAGSIRGGS